MFASSAVYRNDSFTKLVGSDFFNTLGYKETSGRPKMTSAFPPGTDISVAIADFRV